MTMVIDLMQRAQLNIELMDVEESANCADDHIAIHDGRDSSAPLLAKICGDKHVSYTLSIYIISILLLSLYYIYISIPVEISIN